MNENILQGIIFTKPNMIILEKLLPQHTRLHLYRSMKNYLRKTRQSKVHDSSRSCSSAASSIQTGSIQNCALIFIKYDLYEFIWVNEYTLNSEKPNYNSKRIRFDDQNIIYDHARILKFCSSYTDGLLPLKFWMVFL